MKENPPPAGFFLPNATWRHHEWKDIMREFQFFTPSVVTVYKTKMPKT